MGMDVKVLAGILNTSTGRCWASEVNNPCPGTLENVPSSRGYTGGFGAGEGVCVSVCDATSFAYVLLCCTALSLITPLVYVLSVALMIHMQLSCIRILDWPWEPPMQPVRTSCL
jgi:hypothetical protein